MHRCFFALSLLICSHVAFAQTSYWDSLNVNYQLLKGGEYHQNEIIIKIKVPPYLKTSEVMDQVKLAVQWPGDPEPVKKTTVYVFPDNVTHGATSRTGGVYTPRKGFQWDMNEWQPDTSVYRFQPRPIHKLIYNTLLDSMFHHSHFSDDLRPEKDPIKRQVARDFSISVQELDSIYFNIKWWSDRQKRSESQIGARKQ